MEWFNIYGLLFITLIMIPNIIFAVKCKGGFINKWHNRFVETTEQIGRYGCIGFMAFNIPGTVFCWLSLSLIPSIIFLFSGVMSKSIPLIISSILFAPSHIFISYKNAE